MADSIKDKKANYIRVKDILSSKYEEVDGYEFYKYIFPNNQRVGELAEDYSKPNAIYLYRDEYEENPRRTYRRRIMLKDTWEKLKLRLDIALATWYNKVAIELY